MINHARTLLLNRSPASNGYGGLLADEFIEPTFQPVTNLPNYLIQLRRILFGADPDAAYSNYRTRQYMALLHSTELEEFVIALDPRVTYETDSNELFISDLLPLAASPAENIFISGRLSSPDAAGRSFNSWLVTVATSSTVRVRRLTPPTADDTVDVVFTNDLSSLVPLTGSDADVRVRELVGQSWKINGFARPQRSLGETAASVASVGGRYLNDLFGVGTPLAAREPFKTFRNLWNDHPELPYKLGGLLLAVIYQTDRARNRNG